MPTNSESGKRSAIAIKFAPAAHPSSRTRHESAGAGAMPNNNPKVSTRETSDAEIGRLSYGSASYASSSGSDISAEQKFVCGARCDNATVGTSSSSNLRSTAAQMVSLLQQTGSGKLEVRRTANCADRATLCRGNAPDSPSSFSRASRFPLTAIGSSPMRQMQPVLWTKGVLLSPQHFQTQDL